MILLVQNFVLMPAGALFGWSVPAAKPWEYKQDGTPRMPLKRNEPER